MWGAAGAPFPPSPSYGGTPFRSSACHAPAPSASNARTTSGSNCVPAPRADLLGGRLDGPGLLVRPLVDEHVEHVGDVDEPAVERDVVARQPVRGSRRRPSARGGERAARSAVRSRSDSPPASTRAPSTACVLTTSNSSLGQLAGLSRIESGIAILPRSCSGAALADQPDGAVVVARDRARAGRPARRRAGCARACCRRGTRRPARAVAACRARPLVVLARRVERLCRDHGLELGLARPQRAPLDERAQPSRGRRVERAAARRRAPRSARPPARCRGRAGRAAARSALGVPSDAPRPRPAGRRRRPRATSAGIARAGGCDRAGARGDRAPLDRGAVAPGQQQPHPGEAASILVRIMADASDDPRLGTVIAGYRIEERIGRGGMGVVYRAEHLNLQRRAAIKIIAPDLAESVGLPRALHARGADRRRARSTRTSSPSTTPARSTALLYLAMQYIEGEDLSAMLSARDGCGPYRAIDVCRQVASALDAAHAMGLIHRDVKPANVLIEGRTAFLTDFGLTKRLDGTHAQITRVGDVVGTIHYVAPEQIEGRKVSARSDVYSLGCLLYHCLSGQVPFARETDVAVIYAHLSEEPTKLVDVRPDLPGGPRRRDREGARQVAGPPLPELRRHDLRRARGARRGRAARRHDAAAPEHRPRRRSRRRRRGARRRRRGAPPARAARRARRPARARSRASRSASRVDVLEAPADATVDAARDAAAGPRDPRLARARPGSPRCAPTR